MRKQLFLCFILDIFVSGIAWSSDITTIQASLAEVGVKYEINDYGNIVGYFSMDNDKIYNVIIETETFSENGETFRMVRGGLLNRPKASDFTEDQLEWLLVNNGKNKFGGSLLLYGTDDSIISVRIPVPANADGKTLASAMWMCASLLEEADGKIPEVGSSSKSETPKSESSSETTRPKSSASTASADEIITKAEDHDGIVVGGFYLGMSPEDALVLCKHYFGHLGTIKLNKVVWKHRLDGWGELQVKTFEGIVLVTEDGTYKAICSIGNKQDKGPTAVEDMRSAKRGVNMFRFDSKMIRALIGQKKVMSASALGRAFFRKIELDADVFLDDDMEFKTPEREAVVFLNESTTVYFGFDLSKEKVNNMWFTDGLFHIEKAESEHWSEAML